MSRQRSARTLRTSEHQVRPTARAKADESGSLPLVLLAAIILAGVVVIMFGQVRTAEQSVRNDRDFNRAIQYADAGAQAAFTFLTRNEALAEQLVEDQGVDGVLSSDDLPEAFQSQVGRGEYRWQARQIGVRNWQIRSQGFAGEVERVIEIESNRVPLFAAALYGEEIIGGQYVGNFSPGTSPDWQTGGTGAYDGGTGQIDNESDIVAGTGANCNITGPASGEFVQTVFTDEGTGDEISGCQDSAQRRNFPPIADRAFQENGICRRADADLGSVSVIGNDPDGNHPNYPDGLDALGVSVIGNVVTLERGTIYCINNMSWPASHRLVLADGAADEGARVYVKGTLSVTGNGASARKQINVDRHDGPPDAAALQLMFAGNPPGGAIRLTDNNHSWVAAAIYAPSRACEVNTQTKLWGSMICNSFQIQGGVGGFNFWWDTRTANIRSDDDVAIEVSREEFPASTSFDWVSLD